MRQHCQSSTSDASLRSQQGWSFVELIAAVAIVGVALLVMLQQMSISYRENGFSHDCVFAYQKAIGMMAEIQSGVESGVLGDANSLEALDDHEVDNPVLTTLLAGGSPVDPDHTMSGNVEREGEWIWWRQIEVRAVPSSELMRYVRVRIRAQLRSGARVTAASIGSVVHLPVESFPSRQVYDVYALAIANAPSTAQTIEQGRTALTSAITRLEAKNPGLQYRVHWITKFGYGRDHEYMPRINTIRAATDPTAGANAYWYPGILDGSERLFTPELFSGRLKTNLGAVLNGYDASDNPVPHAVADRFNHCVRAPAARRIFAQRVAAGLESVDEPPLQLLLEDMRETPNAFRNALFVNLHGESLPCPPMHNFANPAKDPVNHRDVRAVTHAERLWTPRDPNGDSDHSDSRDAVFRVYAYKTQPGAGSSILTVPITLQILGVDLTSNVNGLNPSLGTTLDVECLAGGVDRGGAMSGDLDYYPFARAKLASQAPEPAEMNFEVGYVATPIPFTWIKLYDTPLITPEVSMRGLHPDARLYGMDYIPSPISAMGTFDVDLSTIDSGQRPKNTARWRITIPKSAFQAGFPGGSWIDVDTVVSVVTRIGDDFTTGTMWPTKNAPANASETYTWWSRSASSVPLTERYQFTGDPRHFPYADGVAGGDGFPHSYNWFFSDLQSASRGNVDPLHWTCLDFARLRDGGFSGNVVDEPRYLQLWRSALESCGAVFQHSEGLLAGSTVLGGEVSHAPHSGELEPRLTALAGGYFGLEGLVNYESLVNDPAFVTPAAAPSGKGESPVIEKRGRTVLYDSLTKFWAKPWLGELAPDDYTAYATDGNLATPRFRHGLRDEVNLLDLPTGTDFAFSSGSRAGESGANEFVHSTEVAGGPITYVESVDPATRATFEGNAYELMYDAGVEPETELSWRWPFRIGGAFVPPAHWVDPVAYPTHFFNQLERLASVGDDPAGVVGTISSVGNDTAFLGLLGATPQDEVERDKLWERSMLAALHVFYAAAEPQYALSVDPLTTIGILEPKGMQVLKNPASVMVRWRTEFTRFDGDPYTPAFSESYAGNEVPLGYVVMVSSDGGETWKYAVDREPAFPGTWLGDNSNYWQADAGTGDESFLMQTPAEAYPDGDYVVRVESYHADRERHYAYHELTFTIKRVVTESKDEPEEPRK